MARTRYNLMKNGEVKSNIDIFYKDPLTFPFKDFKFNDFPKEKELNQIEIERPDILVFSEYNTVEFDDILFWINNISSKYELESDIKIYLPSSTDLNIFFSKNYITI